MSNDNPVSLDLMQSRLRGHICRMAQICTEYPASYLPPEDAALVAEIAKGGVEKINDVAVVFDVVFRAVGGKS